MKYNFNEIIDRRGTHSVKWDSRPENAAADILPLWIADMDFTCPEPVLSALHRRIDRKILGYTLYGNDRLLDTVCSWFRRRYSWDIDKSCIFFSNSIITAFSLLIMALSEEGDGVIIQNPVYFPFTKKIEGNRRIVINSALKRQGSAYAMDFEDLEKKFAEPDNKGMIFCSPHNPVGRVWTENELRRLADIAKKYDKWIISDEIHCDLARPGKKFIPLMKAAPEYKDRIISCTAPSKTFNIAGMQLCNIIISNPEYQKKWIDFTSVRTGLSDGCNPLSLEAAIAAYTEGEEWLEQVLEYIDANIRYVDDFLKKNLPKAVLIESEGTFLVWVDLRAYSDDPKKLEKLLLHEAKLFVHQGYTFGEDGAGYVRINLATPRQNVIECMERMKKALQNI